MRRVFDGTRGVIAFMTLLPLGGSLNAMSLIVLPLTGAIVGVFVLAGYWLGERSGSMLVGGIVALVVDAAMTRGLHYDAIADAADGLAGFVDRQRRLAIMDEPTVGAFGVLAVVVIVLARVAAWSSIGFPVAAIAVFVLSRSAMALAMMLAPSAKEGSLTRIFVAQRSTWIVWTLAIEAIVVAGVVVGLTSSVGLIVIVVGIVTAGGFVLFAVRRLGGMTGDVVGAAGLLSETAMLLAMAVLKIHG